MPRLQSICDSSNRQVIMEKGGIKVPDSLIDDAFGVGPKEHMRVQQPRYCIAGNQCHFLCHVQIAETFVVAEYRGIRRCMSRENLAQDWRIAVDEGFPVGMVRCERKGEQARDLPRGGVLRGKGANITLHATYRFRSQTGRSAGYSGSAQKPLSKGGGTWESE
jgi:hypothetical protein